MDIGYRMATADDLPAIDAVFRTSFCETFGHLYAREDLDTFLAKFTREAWLKEFNDPRYAFRIAEVAGAVVGYVKLGPLSVPVEPTGPAIELRQFYLLKSVQGAGVASELMNWALVEARAREKREMYLTVYTDNHRARRFYDRYGFVEVGPYAFMVGSHADEDIIMKLVL